MDQSKIPEVIKAGGIVLKKKFGYGRYDYASKATEKNSSVQFDLPAGWHKVAVFDNGSDIGAGTTFEVEVTVNSKKGNWMKAELLLSKTKNGAGQIQMQEIDIPVNGKKFTARWRLPSSKESLVHYRWFRVVLNSDGGNVTLSNPRLTKSLVAVEVPTEKAAGNIYPSSDYRYYSWQDSVPATEFSDALGKGLSLTFNHFGDGIHFDLNGVKDLSGYSALELFHWPGTCQHTIAYFDSYRKSNVVLKRGTASNGLLRSVILLDDIVDRRLTPNNGLSASRLVLQGTAVNEKCNIKSINLR